jgi:hypothetical protein
MDEEAFVPLTESEMEDFKNEVWHNSVKQKSPI